VFDCSKHLKSIEKIDKQTCLLTKVLNYITLWLNALALPCEVMLSKIDHKRPVLAVVVDKRFIVNKSKIYKIVPMFISTLLVLDNVTVKIIE
jgi:hypothetical protein